MAFSGYRRTRLSSWRWCLPIAAFEFGFVFEPGVLAFRKWWIVFVWGMLVVCGMIFFVIVYDGCVMHARFLYDISPIWKRFMLLHVRMVR